MSRRDRRQQAGRRGQPGPQQRERRAEQRGRAQAELVYDPATPPARAAAVLLEAFGDQPVEAVVAPTIVVRGDLARARAVAEAALEHRAGPMALSLAADVALMDGRPADAEAYATRALEVSDRPELQLRLAAARAEQGRVAAGVDLLDEVLVPDAGLEELQLARGELLGQLAARKLDPGADCPCGSGRTYGDCCQAADRRALDRFRDRTALYELHEAMAAFTRSNADLETTFAAGLMAWNVAGAISTGELESWTAIAASSPHSPEAATLRLIGEWTWLAPMLEDEHDTLLETFAADPGTPPDLARRAEDYEGWALWGLFELEQAVGSPGVYLTELLSGARVYADLPPEQLEGLARWSVLLGYVVPVDGVWRAGSWFGRASPLEGRGLAHQVLDALVEDAPGMGPEGGELLRWARHTHEEFDALWLPGLTTLPSAEAFGTYEALLRSLAPILFAALRELQGNPPEEESIELVEVRLRVDDQRAAWRALSRHPDVEEDGEELDWYQPAEDDLDDEDPWLKASLIREGDAIVAQVESHDDVTDLVDLFAELGHPATVLSEQAVEEQGETDAPERPAEPVSVPALATPELAGWLQEWADSPLPALDGMTPRQAAAMEGRGRERVEVLIRYLEHELDKRGAGGVDTAALREELNISIVL